MLNPPTTEANVMQYRYTFSLSLPLSLPLSPSLSLRGFLETAKICQKVESGNFRWKFHIFLASSVF